MFPPCCADFLFLPQVFSLVISCLVTPGLLSVRLRQSTVESVHTEYSLPKSSCFCSVDFIVDNSRTKCQNWWSKGVEKGKEHTRWRRFLGCQTDSHVPGGSGSLPTWLHLQFPTPLLNYWEFHHSPGHHTKGSPQKDSWGLPRHCCFWGTRLQSVCELESCTETVKLELWCIEIYI